MKEAGRLFSEKKYADAEKLYKIIYNYSSSFSSLSGMTASLSKQGKYKEVENYIKTAYPVFEKSSSLFNMELIEANNYARLGETNRADSLYNKVIAQDPLTGYTNYASLRKKILSISSDSLSVFADTTDNYRLSMLMEMNKDTIISESVPFITAYWKEAKRKPADLISFIGGRLIVHDHNSAYAALAVSDFALRNMLLEDAQKYAIAALQYKDDGKMYREEVENLKKINWFINFEPDVKSHLVKTEK